MSQTHDLHDPRDTTDGEPPPGAMDQPGFGVRLNASARVLAASLLGGLLGVVLGLVASFVLLWLIRLGMGRRYVDLGLGLLILLSLAVTGTLLGVSRGARLGRTWANRTTPGGLLVSQAQGIGCVVVALAIAGAGWFALPRNFGHRHHETGAFVMLKTLAAAQREHLYRQRNYARSLAELCSDPNSPLRSRPRARDFCERGRAYEYVFSLQARAPEPDGRFAAFSAEAHPIEYRDGTLRSFYVDETGILRGQDRGGRPGTADMPEI